MSKIELSKQCIEKLRWFVDVDDENEKAFILDADIYVKLLRKTLTAEKYNAAPAQKRIEKVRNAFVELTNNDKNFLDRQIDGHISYLDFDNNEKIPSCENMMRALNSTVPPDRKSHSRKMLLGFACRAIFFDWIDKSAGNSSLAEVLKIIIKEAGVKGDAVKIAGEAVSIVGDK